MLFQYILIIYFLNIDVKPPIFSPHPLDHTASDININDSDDVNQLLASYLETDAFKSESGNGNSAHSHIRHQLRRFLAKRVSLKSIRSPVGYTTLLNNVRTGNTPVGAEFLIPTFQRVESSPEPLEIRDDSSRLLAYRFRIPNNFVNTLERETALLPPIQAKATVRGFFFHRHYAGWADSAVSPFMSAEYRNDLPASEVWIAANKPLFDWISQDLRFLNPEMYVKMVSVNSMLPPGVFPHCSAWFGCAINQGIDDPHGTGTHLDKKDDYGTYNCVIPFGNYEGGDLVLWGLKMRMELRPGDVFLFFGSLIAHKVDGITSGKRNVVDMFTHYNVFQWREKVKKGLTEAGKNSSPVGYGQAF